MNIPALIGVDMDLEELHTGMEAVVDGFQGTVTFEPDETVKAQTTEKMAEEAEKLRLLQELKGKENVTLDGHKNQYLCQYRKCWRYRLCYGK